MATSQSCALQEGPTRVVSGIDRADLSRISLEDHAVDQSRVPQSHFVQRSSAHLSKVIGVLFDETAVPKSQVKRSRQTIVGLGAGCRGG